MAEQDPGNKTFVRVTNKKIYETLLEVRDHVKETNGKIRLHRKWLYGLSTLFLVILGWILNQALFKIPK